MIGVSLLEKLLRRGIHKRYVVGDSRYPRRKTIKGLLHIIRNNPQLAQTAVSCLIDLGSAIHLSPTWDEISDLLQGVLSQESLARNACLQVLQVSKSNESNVFN